jgi:hypothetical protein
MSELYVKPLSYWLKQIDDLESPSQIRKLNSLVSHEIMRRKLQTLKMGELNLIHKKCNSKIIELTVDNDDVDLGEFK